MRIPSVKNPRFPGEGSSALGKSGPKERPKGVSDGHLVYNPEPLNRLMERRRRRKVYRLVDFGQASEASNEENPIAIC